MRIIEIDFEVFKALTGRRETEAVTENDVLRALLGLPRSSPAEFRAAATTGHEAGDWLCKGVRFPSGTDFRANYKGAIHYGKVEAGRLVVEGRSAASPSDGAKLITGNNVNGWTFWECRFPGANRWRQIKGLKNGD